MPKRSNVDMADPPRPRYTCKEYREEMTLLNLQRRLHQGGLSEEEESCLKESIKRLKQDMGME